MKRDEFYPSYSANRLMEAFADARAVRDWTDEVIVRADPYEIEKAAVTLIMLLRQIAGVNDLLGQALQSVRSRTSPVAPQPGQVSTAQQSAGAEGRVM